MATTLFTRTTVIWAILVLLTLVSREAAGDLDVRIGSSAALAIAFFKVRQIGLEFMDLRIAPLPLRLAFEGWVVVVGVAMIAFYLR